MNFPRGFKTFLFHSSWSLTLTSGLSYGMGLLRDRIFAHTFGLSRTLDVYNAAFAVPDTIVQVAVYTALSAAFVPLFTKQYDEQPSLGYAYARQLLSWSAVFMTAVGLVAAIFLPLFAHRLVPGFSPEEVRQYITLTRLLFVSALIFTFSGVYGKMLISFKEFLWYGLSPALYNVGIVAGALLWGRTLGSTGLVLGTLMGAGLHVLIRFWVLRRKKHLFRHTPDLTASPEIRETLKLTAPKWAQYGLYSLQLVFYTGLATKLGAGSVAAYNYARNFMSLPVSLLGIAIALSMYPALSHDAARGRFEKFRQDFRQNLWKCLAYTSAAAVAMAFLAKFLVGLLLGGGRFDAAAVTLVASVLVAYTLAIPLESLLHIYHRAFYSLRNTFTPAFVQSMTCLASLPLAAWLSTRIGVLAIPVSFTADLLVHITILAVLFPGVLDRKEKAFAA